MVSGSDARNRATLGHPLRASSFNSRVPALRKTSPKWFPIDNPTPPQPHWAILGATTSQHNTRSGTPYTRVVYPAITTQHLFLKYVNAQTVRHIKSGNVLGSAGFTYQQILEQPFAKRMRSLDSCIVYCYAKTISMLFPSRPTLLHCNFSCGSSY